MKVLFPGSFDPFTEGHSNIVCRALRLFDSVVVAVGENSDKDCLFPASEREEQISRRYAGEPRVSVVRYSDMTVDCCRRNGCGAIVRGVRNARDLEYEQTVAAVNHRLAPEIDTLLFPADPALRDVSSTLERERLLHAANPGR
ncbi:MAG: pantetheine-phosphate adenylyltransferase [bacterium P3]|nr:MAG: pantetheine-phosphate adenylyltransferase [bacterium P3]KWW40673.1 MAG: pantetheine-phosphate adenylyltransferase [bacterium F083]